MFFWAPQGTCPALHAVALCCWKIALPQLLHGGLCCIARTQHVGVAPPSYVLSVVPVTTTGDFDMAVTCVLQGYWGTTGLCLQLLQRVLLFPQESLVQRLLTLAVLWLETCQCVCQVSCKWVSLVSNPCVCVCVAWNLAGTIGLLCNWQKNFYLISVFVVSVLQFAR